MWKEEETLEEKKTLGWEKGHYTSGGGGDTIRGPSTTKNKIKIEKKYKN